LLDTPAQLTNVLAVTVDGLAFSDLYFPIRIAYEHLSDQYDCTILAVCDYYSYLFVSYLITCMLKLYTNVSYECDSINLHTCEIGII
jgi:hypothetical protein